MNKDLIKQLESLLDIDTYLPSIYGDTICNAITALQEQQNETHNLSVKLDKAKGHLKIERKLSKTRIEELEAEDKISNALLEDAKAKIEQYEQALEQSKEAVDFFDKVGIASNDERIAVGTDHLTLIIDACRCARTELARIKDGFSLDFLPNACFFSGASIPSNRILYFVLD